MDRRIAAAAFLLAAGALFAADPALAGAARTFVSGHGSDSNACTLTAPCRSFAQALSQTTAGGEITVLDPAGYGAVTITQSVSINNDGVGEAGVTVAVNGSDAIIVNTGVSDVVSLRGLTLVGAGNAAQVAGNGNNGITFSGAGTLNIENCVIRGFVNGAQNANSGYGIFAQPNGTAAFNISDTIVSNNASSGISIAPLSGNTAVYIDRAGAFSNGTQGVIVMTGSTGALTGIAKNSAVSGNGASGFEVSAQTQPAIFSIADSQTANNAQGLYSIGAAATMYISGVTVSGNTNGYVGTIKTYGGNAIVDTINLGALTPAATQ